MKKIGMIVAVEIEAVLSKYGKPSSHLTECGFDIMKYNCKGYELIIAKSRRRRACGSGRRCSTSFQSTVWIWS